MPTILSLSLSLHLIIHSITGREEGGGEQQESQKVRIVHRPRAAGKNRGQGASVSLFCLSSKNLHTTTVLNSDTMKAVKGKVEEEQGE